MNGRSFPVAFTAAAIACSAGGSGPQIAPTTRTGAYEFMANLPGVQLHGVMAVLPDTVIIETREAECRPPLGFNSSTTFSYVCDPVGRFHTIRYVIDRRNPVQFSKWYAVEQVRRERRVCVQYAVDRNGRRYCVRYDTEVYDANQGYSGQLIVRPRDPG